MELHKVTDIKKGAQTTPKELIGHMVEEITVYSPSKPFIEANTIESTLMDIRSNHIIPVFIKDNEPLISQSAFIEIAETVIKEVYSNNIAYQPSIRLSHPIKGRIPGAKNKKANELLEHEKTLYYERMAFCIDIPSIYKDINGNRITLSIGGIKAYNLDNLYSTSNAEQHFKMFIGFKNLVCTNLCISSDGYVDTLKVKSEEHLYNAIHSFISTYNYNELSNNLIQLNNYSITEQQFANLIGRCRMFRYIPNNEKQNIPDLPFGDNQINHVCKSFYNDTNFSHSDTKELSLWNLYNLFTGANKNSYIDTFCIRGVAALQLVNNLQLELDNISSSWYLN